jgi:hypothetical protein
LINSCYVLFRSGLRKRRKKHLSEYMKYPKFKYSNVLVIANTTEEELEEYHLTIILKFKVTKVYFMPRNKETNIFELLVVCIYYLLPFFVAKMPSHIKLLANVISVISVLSFMKINENF